MGVFFAEIFDDAFDCRENDEQVGGKKTGDEGGEFVVIAEFDFGKGDSVVFVDDGDNAVLEEADECVAGVQMALVMFEVGVREENLGDVEIVFGEKLFVSGHQARLAEGGAGLKFGEFGGTFGVAEKAHSGADSA